VLHPRKALSERRERREGNSEYSVRKKNNEFRTMVKRQAAGTRKRSICFFSKGGRASPKKKGNQTRSAQKKQNRAEAISSREEKNCVSISKGTNPGRKKPQVPPQRTAEGAETPLHQNLYPFLGGPMSGLNSNDLITDSGKGKRGGGGWRESTEKSQI